MNVLTTTGRNQMASNKTKPTTLTEAKGFGLSVSNASLERLERKAIRTKLKRQTKTRLLSPNEREELRTALIAKIFGSNNDVIITPTISKETIIKQNSDKYTMISQGFCTVTFDSSLGEETHNGRFSKSENQALKNGKQIDEDSTIDFYSCTTQEYISFRLADVSKISANHFVKTFK